MAAASAGRLGADALCDKVVSNPSDQQWKDWISPDIPTKNHAQASVDRTSKRVDRRHFAVLRPSGGRLHHHVVIALDATIECLAPVLCGLGAPVDRLHRSNHLDLDRCAATHIIENSEFGAMSAPLIGVDGTPDGCAFEMPETQPFCRFHRSGYIGRETLNAVRAVDRGRLRVGSCGVAPRLRLASVGCDRHSARAAPTVAGREARVVDYSRRRQF
jgi:hypothetical protein